ncbi:hypothetical protein [Nocardioides sp. SYSU D00038]|uniref:hypothetical protein n=1 Tax=Nocardioides sp. SYSU D00038 TaxID=2812554 RepID=UPI0019676BFC|nr:hypothetical protein [Nocardioides sp. SYSU D00038]
MIIEAGQARSLGSDGDTWLRFGEEAKAPGAWAGRRLLFAADKPAFELSFWCGTCQFVFRRLEGANEGGSLEALQERLTQGLDDLDDDVVQQFGSALPLGDYLPILLEVAPRLVSPAQPEDYFAHEQVDTWGLESFWGLPVYPQTPYYRTFETRVDADAHMYEFVVPMVPPSWNERSRVREFEHLLDAGSQATAVAVSILDVCQPASDLGPDYHAHWALTHFLIDGHHKMEAAANGGRPIRLLTLLSVRDGLAFPEQVARVPELRSRPMATREGAA